MIALGVDGQRFHWPYVGVSEHRQEDHVVFCPYLESHERHAVHRDAESLEVERFLRKVRQTHRPAVEV
jgi:hypothetical protein